MKKYTYPKSATLTNEKGSVVLSALTQLYQVGVYACVYEGDQCVTQLHLSPAQAIKFMAQFKRNNLVDGITSQFGSTITVVKKDGLWHEYEEDEQ